MEVKISGLKCDHCSYRDDTVKFEEYEASIGKPCPECGQSLLTQKEYNSCVRIMKWARIATAIGKVTRWLNPFHYISLITGKKLETTITANYPNRKV